MIRKGNSRTAGSAMALALAALALIGCGSGGGSTSTGPALSAGTAGHLAKLSDKIASDLDAGETCTAAHVADDLATAVQAARLPASIEPGIADAASRLVDQVNCPPPPPPAPAPKPKEPKPKDHGNHGDHGGDGHGPPGHSDQGAFVPPGQAKLKGEPG